MDWFLYDIKPFPTSLVNMCCRKRFFPISSRALKLVKSFKTILVGKPTTGSSETFINIFPTGLRKTARQKCFHIYRQVNSSQLTLCRFHLRLY